MIVLTVETVLSG